MKLRNLVFVVAAFLLFQSPASFAADEMDQAEQTTAEQSKQPHFLAAVKEKYALTDEQIKAMQDKGIQPNQMAMIAELSKSSGKSLVDVTNMRVDQKMGWGKIAKELGVHPREIGQAVASLHRSEAAERQQERKEMRKEVREDLKAARKEARAERKAERAEAKANRGKGH